jgi:hypothetical protein
VPRIFPSPAVPCDAVKRHNNATNIYFSCCIMLPMVWYMYLGGTKSKSQPGHKCFGRCFMVFLSPYRKMPGSYLEIGSDLFLPHPFQFGCAIVTAISHRLLTVMAQVHSQVRSSGINSGRYGTGEGCLRVLWFFLPILIPQTAPHSLIILSPMLCRLATDSIVM